MAGNVLESIYLSIKADTKELRSSLVEVNKRLIEVEKHAKKSAMEVKKNKPAANIASGAVEELTGKLKQLAMAYFSVQGAIKTVNNYLSSSLDMGYAAQGMNENIETVNAFGEAVARNGGTIQGFQNSLSTLTDKMRKARLEGEAGIYTPLARLGVGGFNADTKGTDMMLRIAERMKGMSDSAAFTFGRELGFDDATIRTLQQGSGEVEKLILKYKELGVYSQKDFEAARKLKSAMLDLRQSFVYLQTQLMRFVAPALELIAIKMTAITKWMRDNEQFIRIFFTFIAAAITMIAIPAILRMAAAWIAAFAPLIILAGIVALLADDFLVWQRGGKSALGWLYESSADFIKTLKTIKKEIKEIWGSVKTDPSPANLIKNFERLINLKNLLKKPKATPKEDQVDDEIKKVKGGIKFRGKFYSDKKISENFLGLGKNFKYNSDEWDLYKKLNGQTPQNTYDQMGFFPEALTLPHLMNPQKYPLKYPDPGPPRTRHSSSTVTNDNKTVSYNYNFYGVPVEEAGKAISSIALEANT
jgi:hypothetical protein